MSGSLNKAIIVGRLGRSPELRYAKSGTPVTNLNVATDESYTDRAGNRVEQTEWHRVTVFNKQAEACAQYLNKGSLVLVEGRIQTQKWEDKEGRDRYTTQIKAQRVQFLESKGTRSSGPGNNSGATQPETPPNGPAFPNDAAGMDDAPF